MSNATERSWSKYVPANTIGGHGGRGASAELTGTAINESQLEEHRVALTGYCYRMLGSAFEADDAVQETMLRAWKSIDRFEGRSSVRSWLYKIASNVCFDMTAAKQRRARPMDLGTAGTHESALPAPLPETTWLEPIPESSVIEDRNPEDVAVARETIRLAFVAALQHLPPTQRAVLIFRASLEGRRGGRAPRHDGYGGEQRVATCEGDHGGARCNNGRCARAASGR